MVTLRAMPGAATDVCLHPLGTLTVTQSVVPLNLEISKFGAAVPAGARSFTISSVSLGSLGGQHQTPPSVTDFFARAQFFEMSDAESSPAPHLNRCWLYPARMRSSSPGTPTIG
jgi:hypothetical protein